MIEAFTADHGVSINEVLFDWPASKFEAFYEAFCKRKVADELNTRRSLEIAAIWGNSNYDSSDNPEIRQNVMEAIDKGYSIALMRLYDQLPEEPEIDKDDPFFKAMEKGMEKRKLPNPKLTDEIN